MGFDRDMIPQKTATELVRNLHEVKEELGRGPIQITSHGRNDFVLMSQKQFEHLSGLTGTSTERLDAKLRLVMEMVDSFILILDDELKVRRANKAFCDFFNYDQDEIRGMPLESLPRTANDSYLAVRARAVVSSGRAESFEMPSSHRPGRTLQIRIRPWPNGIVTVFNDITDSLRDKNRILRDIAFDTAISVIPGFGTTIINPNGNLVVASLSIARLFGASRDALKGVSIFSLLSGECTKLLKSVLQGTDNTPQKCEVEYLRNGQDFAPGILSMAPFLDNFGQRMVAATLFDPAMAQDVRADMVAS